MKMLEKYEIEHVNEMKKEKDFARVRPFEFESDIYNQIEREK